MKYHTPRHLRHRTPRQEKNQEQSYFFNTNQTQVQAKEDPFFQSQTTTSHDQDSVITPNSEQANLVQLTPSQPATNLNSAEILKSIIEVAPPHQLRTIIQAFEIGTISPDGLNVTTTLFGIPVSLAIAVVNELRVNATKKLVHQLMEVLADIHEVDASLMKAAKNDAERRAQMKEMHDDEAPFLTEIRLLTVGQPNQWKHPDPRVQDAVLAALQMEAVFNAEADLESPKNAHADSASAAGMDQSYDWCGFFVGKSYMQAGLDRKLRVGFFHVNNVEDYFTYKYAFGASSRVQKWIYSDNAWQELKAYHAARGSERTWINAATIKSSAGNLDIRSGDTVLIDHSGKPQADHIVMVHSWNPVTKTLFTIGGNDGGYEVDTSPAHIPPKKETSEELEKRTHAEQATGKHLKKGGSGGHVGVGSYDLSGTSKKRVRIFGIGRPSIADFENHTYDSTNSKTPPKQPPK